MLRLLGRRQVREVVRPPRQLRRVRRYPRLHLMPLPMQTLTMWGYASTQMLRLSDRIPLLLLSSLWVVSGPGTNLFSDPHQTSPAVPSPKVKDTKEVVKI